MFYNFGKSNRLVGKSVKWTNTHTDKIVGTPSIIEEEVKDKIKSQARKSTVFTSKTVNTADDSICSSNQGQFPQNTHPHNRISQINNPGTAHRTFCCWWLICKVRWHHLLFTKGTDSIIASGCPTFLKVSWNSVVCSFAGLTAFFSATTKLLGVDFCFFF